MRLKNELIAGIVAVALAGILVGAYFTWFRAPGALVVYCAHDAVFADAILKQFTAETGIPVAVKYDTEATKSLGLVELLKSEKNRPQCDVFWNNELLGTLDLKAAGVLEPYIGPNHARIPEQYRDPEGYWAGFAARLRMWIFNTEIVGAFDAGAGRYLESTTLQSTPARFALAKPLYGTTLTHFCVLWNIWGEDKTKVWFADIKARGAKVMNGNAAVRDVVAAGECTIGYTDTDDYFEAQDKGKPVFAEPVLVSFKGPPVSTEPPVESVRYSICIPNSVAIIKGTPRVEAARKLVDYLLSEATEVALANSASRQIPLGAVDADRLPQEVRELTQYVKDGYPLGGLLEVRTKVIAWLKEEGM